MSMNLATSEIEGRSRALTKELLRLARAHTDALGTIDGDQVRIGSAYALLAWLATEHCGGTDAAVTMLRKTPWEPLMRVAADFVRAPITFEEKK